MYIIKNKIFLFWYLFVIGFILMSGFAQRPAMCDTKKTLKKEPLKGVSLSPKSFKGNDFTDFFEKAKQTGQIIMWAGDWIELSYHDKGGAKVVAEFASKYHYIPLIEATFFTQHTGKLVRPLDEATKQKYKNSAVKFVEKYKPRYIGFGIEINVLYEKAPDDFQDFIPFYNEVYDAVKAQSPDTKVFTVFQLEKMKGLTFWTNSTADPTKTEWWMIDEFKSDIVAFTTYPGLVYKDPSQIPPEYYNEINSHTTKPIAFTEIGWHSEASPLGWESSDAEQAEFVKRFFRLTEDLNLELLIWSFLYDPQTIEPFKSMGLRSRKDGRVRPALKEWIRK